MTTTLLAVDDSKTMRKVLEITFAGEDEYRAVLADSAEDALTKLRAHKPRLVLVDAALLGTSGYDLCQKIKAEAPGTAIILLSSKQQPFDRGKGTSVGVDDFIDKPFDTQQLIDKVGSVLKQAAQAPAPIAQRPAAPPIANRPAPVAQAAHAADVRPRVPTVSYGAPAVKPSAAAPNVVATGRVGVTTQSGVGTPSAPLVGAVRPMFQPQPAAAIPAVAVSSAARPVTGAAVSPVVVARTAAVASAAKPAAASVERAPVAPMIAVGQTVVAGLEGRLQGLGLTSEQVRGVLSLSKDVVEQVVWEIVPVLAETLIREEIERLTRD